MVKSFSSVALPSEMLAVAIENPMSMTALLATLSAAYWSLPRYGSVLCPSLRWLHAAMGSACRVRQK